MGLSLPSPERALVQVACDLASYLFEICHPFLGPLLPCPSAASSAGVCNRSLLAVLLTLILLLPSCAIPVPLSRDCYACPSSPPLSPVLLTASSVRSPARTRCLCPACAATERIQRTPQMREPVNPERNYLQTATSVFACCPTGSSFLILLVMCPEKWIHCKLLHPVATLEDYSGLLTLTF